MVTRPKGADPKGETRTFKHGVLYSLPPVVRDSVRLGCQPAVRRHPLRPDQKGGRRVGGGGCTGHNRLCEAAQPTKQSRFPANRYRASIASLPLAMTGVMDCRVAMLIAMTAATIPPKIHRAGHPSRILHTSLPRKGRRQGIRISSIADFSGVSGGFEGVFMARKQINNENKKRTCC